MIESFSVFNSTISLFSTSTFFSNSDISPFNLLISSSLLFILVSIISSLFSNLTIVSDKISSIVQIVEILSIVSEGLLSDKLKPVSKESSFSIFSLSDSFSVTKTSFLSFFSSSKSFVLVSSLFSHKSKENQLSSLVPKSIFSSDLFFSFALESSDSSRINKSSSFFGSSFQKFIKLSDSPSLFGSSSKISKPFSESSDASSRVIIHSAELSFLDSVSQKSIRSSSFFSELLLSFTTHSFFGSSSQKEIIQSELVSNSFSLIISSSKVKSFELSESSDKINKSSSFVLQAIF
jgi:hypothetical protein